VNTFRIDEYEKIAGRNSPVAVEDLFILLGKVHDAFGFIPRQVVEDLAERSGVPAARIFGALTAYKDLHVRDAS